MNKAKLSLIVASVALMSSFSNRTLAQEKPVTFGLKGGINLSTFGGSFKDAKSSFRYQFGVTADISLSNNFYILTGLDLQTKCREQTFCISGYLGYLSKTFTM